MADLQSAMRSPQGTKRQREAESPAAGLQERLQGQAASDPDLARIVAAWPTLPEPIRRAMLALADIAK